MARFSLVFVAAGVLLFVAMAATAEASTKTITTTTIEENPTGGQRGFACAKPMVEQEMLSHCRMYLSITGRGQGTMENPVQEHFQFCCDQLRNMGSEQCMCEGIKMMMNMQGWTQQGGMGQMLRMAQNLPQQCNLMSQSCQMRAVVF